MLRLFARAHAAQAAAAAARDEAVRLKVVLRAEVAALGTTVAKLPRPSTKRDQNGTTNGGNSGSSSLNGHEPVSTFAAMAAVDMNWDSLQGRVRLARMYRRLSRAQLSIRAGYSSTSTVKRYELDPPTMPQDEVIYRLAEALGCDPAWLLSGQGEPNWDPAWRNPQRP